MLRKDIEKLVRVVERQLIGILLANGLVTSKKKKFSDVKLTQKGKSAIGIGDPLITNEWIQEWRKMWPEKHRGNLAVIREKISRFLSEHDCTLIDIKEATKRWLMEKDPPYCGTANNFLYKYDTNSRVEESRCEQYVELIKSEPELQNDDYSDIIL